jgi:HK97 family phage portal protein
LGFRSALGRIFTRGQDPSAVYAETATFVGFLNAPTSPAPDAGPLVETETVNPAISRCIDVISEDAASVPLRLFDVRGDQPVEVLDHPAIELFRTINPIDTPTVFWRTVFADLITEGNLFAFMERSRDGIPQKLVRLPPEQIEVVPDPKRMIGGYNWKRPGQPQPQKYTTDEIMHIRTRNPESAYRGMGMLVRLRDQILLERAARQWRLNHFLNGIPTSVIINVERGVGTDAEWEAFQEQFWQRMKGPANSGKPLFTKGQEVKVTVLPRPTEDEVGYLALLAFIRGEYAMRMGVPPSRLSDYSESFRANASEQGRTYWQDTIMAWHRLVLDYLNSTFLPHWFPDARIQAGRRSLEFAFDYSKVRALALSQRDQAQLNEILIRNGMRTPNEAAVSMGDPSHDDEKADELYMNGKPLGEDTSAVAAPGDPAAMPGGDMGPNGQDGSEGDAGTPPGRGVRSASKNGRRAHVRR